MGKKRNRLYQTTVGTSQIAANQNCGRRTALRVVARRPRAMTGGARDAPMSGVIVSSQVCRAGRPPSSVAVPAGRLLLLQVVEVLLVLLLEKALEVRGRLLGVDPRLPQFGADGADVFVDLAEVPQVLTEEGHAVEVLGEPD